MNPHFTKVRMYKAQNKAVAYPRYGRSLDTLIDYWKSSGYTYMQASVVKNYATFRVLGVDLRRGMEDAISDQCTAESVPGVAIPWSNKATKKFEAALGLFLRGAVRMYAARSFGSDCDSQAWRAVGRISGELEPPKGMPWIEHFRAAMGAKTAHLPALSMFEFESACSVMSVGLVDAMCEIDMWFRLEKAPEAWIGEEKKLAT